MRGLVVLFALVPAAACSFLRPLDDLEPSSAEARGAGGAGEVGGGAGAGAGGSLGDDAGGAGQGTGGGANHPCEDNGDCLDVQGICREKKQGGQGFCEPCPGGMALGVFDGGRTYCIEEREVTQADYDLFLQAVRAGEAVGSNYAVCKNDVEHDPGAGGGGDDCRADYRPVEKGKLPVTCVDFCDAAAYCLWKGKGLCGDQNSTQITIREGGEDELQNFAHDQWFVACGGLKPGRRYPYGDAPDPDACNANRPDAGPVEGGTFPRCVTDAGVYDLSGNVAEWGGRVESGPVALIRGGSYLTTSAGLASCLIDVDAPESEYLISPTSRRSDVGFRCCDD